jgi:hypothetical protein
MAKGFVELWGLQSIIANSIANNAGSVDKKQKGGKK